LIYWDIIILSIDATWSLWKSIELYIYGYYFFDQGLYVGRLLGDIYAIVFWALCQEKLTPYWTDIWSIYQKYNIAWTSNTWQSDVDFTLNHDETVHTDSVETQPENDGE
jgi:hypothetical protein